MPTSKMANVIKIALEDKGHNYSASTVQRWLEQKSCPPPSLAEVFNSIVVNIDHHLVAAQTKALLGKERNVKALKKVHKKPIAQRRLDTNRKRQLSFGEEKMHLGYTTVTKEEKEVLTAMARILKVGRSGLVRLWLKSALQDVLSELSPGESFENLMTTDSSNKSKNMPSKIARDFISFSRNMVDKEGPED